MSAEVIVESTGEKAFGFGSNWQSFIDKHLNEERVAEAVKSLEVFCGKDALAGKTFLDIGCGSGLFSLAARKLGASKIVSMDIDPNSVACCRQLHESLGSPDDWQVVEGSVLDQDFMNSLGEFDFVYSWGVLHHTGSMWQAIDNAAARVAKGGGFYIAIYNEADGFQFMPDGRIGNSKLWLWEKKFYMSMPGFIQGLIDLAAQSAMILVYLLTLRNPIQQIKNHKQLRGMSWSVDIKDWLGGYPYEYAKSDALFNLLKFQGLNIEKLKCHNGLLNNELYFSRTR
ncbi:MAG: class I SAM-dependent methyltransferase [Candidatus Melainabacteria bacterium]|nr:class I SAM-dependent methyltransferase [Candidatus Melainabacteria bacterium]